MIRKCLYPISEMDFSGFNEQVKYYRWMHEEHMMPSDKKKTLGFRPRLNECMKNTWL